MTNRFLEKPLTHYAMLLVTILGKKLFTKLRLILLFISINSKSQHGSVPYHLKLAGQFDEVNSVFLTNINY